MARSTIRSLDDQDVRRIEVSRTEREEYRARRSSMSRRRSRKTSGPAPGGMHQRRNKHWTW